MHFEKTSLCPDKIYMFSFKTIFKILEGLYSPVHADEERMW